MNRIRFIRTVSLASVAVLAWHIPASAQVKLEFQVSPMATGTFYLGDPPAQFAIHRQQASPLIIQNGAFDDALGVGVNAGLRIAERFGIEGMVFWVPTQLKAETGLNHVGGTTDVNALMYGGTLVYYFGGLQRFEPFLGVGVGGETVSYTPEMAWERHTDLMANGVIGAHYWVADRMAIRFEARDCLTRFNSEIPGIDNATENDLMLSVGLTLRAPLGGSK